MKRESGKRLASGKPEKPPKKKGIWDWKLTVLVVLAVLLAIALAGVLLWRSLFVRPELPGRDGDQAGDTGPDTGQEGPSTIDWGDGIRPLADGERKSEDYWTVLILGRDTGGGGNTDTMLLASYDVTNQKATVMSIPRDTMVNIPYDIKRINAVYNYNGGGEKGIQGLYKEISQLVGFEPDFQVVVEWDAVGEIVDAMGGVWFDVPMDMNYRDPYQDLRIQQAAGYRLLTGEDAMQVLRYRYDTGKKRGYAEGDIGRIKTQQAFLTAMVDQLLQVKNIAKLNEFADVFKRNVETDLSIQNIFWFAKAAVMGGLKMEDVHFVTAPGNYVASCWSRTYREMQSYVTLYPKQLLKLVNEELSPFKEVFTLSDLDIMTVNADGSVSSSTGYVEDRRAASPPVRPSADPEPDENDDPTEPGTATPGDTPGTGSTVPGDEPNGGGTTVIDPLHPNGPEDPAGAGGTENPGNSGIPGGPETPGGTQPPDPGGADQGTAEPPPGDPGAGTEAPAVPEPPPVPEVPSEPGFSIIEPPQE